MTETLKPKAYAYRLKASVLLLWAIGYSALAYVVFTTISSGEYLYRIGPMRVGETPSLILSWSLFGIAACLAAYYLVMLLFRFRLKHRLVIGSEELRIPLSQFSKAIAAIPYDRIESLEVRLDGRHRLSKRAKSTLVIRSVEGREYEIREKYLAGPKTFRRVHADILNRTGGVERQEAVESLSAMAD